MKGLSRSRASSELEGQSRKHGLAARRGGPWVVRDSVEAG